MHGAAFLGCAGEQLSSRCRLGLHDDGGSSRDRGQGGLEQLAWAAARGWRDSVGARRGIDASPDRYCPIGITAPAIKMIGGVVDEEKPRAIFIAVCTVISLSLLAGSMLAGAVWYLSADINAVAIADNQALAKQWQLFQDSNMMVVQRVTTLEAERTEDRSGIDHLSVAIDQERAALNDLATAVTKLQAAVDAGQRRR